MNVFVLYLLLLKATLTSFSGMASLPMVRDDFVVAHRVLTDRQLNTAVAAGRTGPGPNGIYVVSVGYFVSGWSGALAGLLAVMTPAFLVLPLMMWMGARAGTPRVKSAIRAVVLASAGLLLSASLPLARDAVTGFLTLAIVVVSFILLSFTRLDTVWVMLGAALVGLAAKLSHGHM
jgi:chromate transporter